MAAVIVKKSLAEMRANFYAECRRLAEKCWAEYMRNPYQRLYLVGKKTAGLDTLDPRSEIWAEFSIEGEDHREQGWLCVRPETLSRASTAEVLTSTIMEWLRREPLWIFAD